VGCHGGRGWSCAGAEGPASGGAAAAPPPLRAEASRNGAEVRVGGWPAGGARRAQCPGRCEAPCVPVSGVSGGAGKEPGPRFMLRPIGAEHGEECRREHARPLVRAFAVPPPQDQAGAVHSRDRQRAPCRHPQPRRRERGEDGPLLQVAWGAQERRDCGWAKEDRPCEGPLRRRDILQYLWASEGNAGEETPCADGLDHRSPGHLVVLEEQELLGADRLRAQGLGGSPQVPGAVGDTAEGAVPREGRVVAELPVCQQALAQGRHGQASRLQAWTPSGQNSDDRRVGVTLLTEESWWSRQM